MRSIVVGDNEAGQRFDKLLLKYLNRGSKSFVYKMLRKKNILLNGKRAEGNERLIKGDEIKLFFSEETFDKLIENNIIGTKDSNRGERKGAAGENVKGNRLADDFRRMIVFENRDVVIINKPVGILSQKSEAGDNSLVEYLTEYLLHRGILTEKELETFKPAVCNRLDRNTGGMVVAGKSLCGLQCMSELFRNRSISKYYMCIVRGNITEAKSIKGYLHKDRDKNLVTVVNTINCSREDYVPIETEYRPVKHAEGYTLLEVKLITGKTHQIRAHLSGMGHPIAGDCKYGSMAVNEKVRKKYGVRSQLLFAYRMVFPNMNEAAGATEDIKEMSNKEIRLDLPDTFFIRL